MNTIVGIGVALILGLFAAMGVRIHTLSTSNDTKDAAIATLVKDQGYDRARIAQFEKNESANAEAKAKADTAIDELRKRLSDAVGAKQAVEALAKAAEQLARASARSAALARDQLLMQREDLYATDATCAAWRAAPVCSGISHGLRIEWDQARSIALRSDDSPGDRGGSPSTVRAAAIQPDGDPVTAALASAYRWTDALAVNRYSNGQVQDALTECLSGYGQAAGQLGAIGRLGVEAAGVAR